MKDPLWIKEPGKPARAHFGPVGEGLVDWRGWMEALAARGYDGPLSFHSEYEGWPEARIVEQTRKDIAFMRSVESEANGK